ncbi:RWD-domain-containing protein [Martensiomyces pterosporus]|nr:RWD-domain-containing protein [Martensiomyces pterosporus]
MSDDHYAEEQRSEVDILQSIYPTEFEEISQDPYKFSIAVAVDDDDDIPACCLSLTVEYTATYPDELPNFEISAEESENEVSISDGDVEEFTAKTREIGEESLGMAMVFNMAMNLKELAVQRLSEKVEAVKKREEERIQKEIEADQKKFIGTRVTRASFLEWKEGFDKDMNVHMTKLAAEANDERSASKRGADSKKGDRLTGRQLFEQDKSLAQSDARFISEGDVSVDASLFEKEETLSDDSDDE